MHLGQGTVEANLLEVSQLKLNHYNSDHSRAFEFPAGNSQTFTREVFKISVLCHEAENFDSNLVQFKQAADEKPCVGNCYGKFIATSQIRC